MKTGSCTGENGIVNSVTLLNSYSCNFWFVAAVNFVNALHNQGKTLVVALMA